MAGGEEWNRHVSGTPRNLLRWEQTQAVKRRSLTRGWPPSGRGCAQPLLSREKSHTGLFSSPSRLVLLFPGRTGIFSKYHVSLRRGLLRQGFLTRENEMWCEHLRTVPRHSSNACLYTYTSNYMKIVPNFANFQLHLQSRHG